MKININCLSLALCGGNRFIFELSNGLVDRGFKVTLNHAGLSKYYRWFKPIKAEVLGCGASLVDRLLHRTGIRKFNKQRLRRLRKNVPDCDVNVATYYLTAKPTVESGVGVGFYLVQGYEADWCSEKWLPAKVVAEESYRLPLKHLCVSDWLTRKVGGVNIGNGLNLKVFRRMPEIEKVPNSFMVTVRRGISWKHPEVTWRFAECMQAKDYPVFVADGSLSEEEMVKMYNRAEYFVNFSEREGFGYNCLEAMSCGCKVISSPSCEYLEDMVNCYVIQKPYFENAIIAFGRISSNRALGETLVSEGYCTAQAFNFDSVVDRFVAAVSQEVN